MNMSIFTKVSQLSFNFSGELQTAKGVEPVTIEEVKKYLNQDSNHIADFTLTINKLHHGYKDEFVKVIKKGDSLELHGNHTMLLLFLNDAYYYISGNITRNNEYNITEFKNN